MVLGTTAKFDRFCKTIANEIIVLINPANQTKFLTGRIKKETYSFKTLNPSPSIKITINIV